MNRKKKAVFNIVSSLALQMVTLICGLILPRLLLSFFGSEVNGTISSITQFLSYIVLLEAGVGGVIKAALYKPLANNDRGKISGVIKATEKFFRKIAYIFIAYMLILALVFSTITNSNFGFLFTASLIIIIGISTAAQYFFGITYQILLTADQKGYINNGIQIVTIILNTLLSALLVYMGCSIHVVKLGSAVVFVIRPLLTLLYVRKHYYLDNNALSDNNAIKQKWDGFGQHIAYFIHSNTDIVVLSVFSNMLIVSVYTIHMSVISGIKNLCNSLSMGFGPALGDMIARKETEKLQETVNFYEFVSFYIAFLFFTVTAIMLEPFITLYTLGVTDINYYHPLFAAVMCFSEGIYVIRCVYSSIVMSAGHFKQTNKGSYIEALINITISVVLVKFYGLIGVAIGTCVAMSYRTIDYVIYLSKNIINKSPRFFIKRFFVNILSIVPTVLISYLFIIQYITNWMSWIICAGIVFAITFISITVGHCLFYKKEVNLFISILKKKYKREK